MGGSFYFGIKAVSQQSYLCNILASTWIINGWAFLKLWEYILSILTQTPFQANRIYTFGVTTKHNTHAPPIQVQDARIGRANSGIFIIDEYYPMHVPPACAIFDWLSFSIRSH